MFKNIIRSIREIFGFSHNSKYVKSYLNAANMHSGAFMAAVIFILETWLIIRQHDKYIIPKLQAGGQYFDLLFKYTSCFWLLLFLGFSLFFYCIFFGNIKNNRKKAIVISVFALVGLVLCSFLPNEAAIKSWSNAAIISNILLIVLYATIALAQISILFGTIYQYKGGKKEWITSIVVITLFALVCLVFGVRVSYTDFYTSTGLQPKQFICFLMMAIYVGCLLIWKPYISIAILGTVFLAFYLLVKRNAGDVTLNYYQAADKGMITSFITADGTVVNISDIGYVNDGTFVGIGDSIKKVVMSRTFLDGDEVNYITFFISLTMVCISIYVQRNKEAHKDERLEYLATTDPLTDIYSFNHFIDLVNDKRKKERLKTDEWSFVFFDIVGFKIYNDQKGFEEGNKFLIFVAQMLKEAFPSGIISRQADDHFVGFVNRERGEDVFLELNEKIKSIDKDIQPYLVAGVYIYRDENEDTRVSIEKARYACSLLKSKNLSRTHLFYDQFMHDEYRKKQYVVRHIDDAIQNGYIKAYYQPVVWSNDGMLCGAESLARWDDPKYGFLSPASFVDALEASQLIYKLDLEILRIVCENLRYNIDHQLAVFPISVNFSRVDFLAVDIVSLIDEVVTDYNVPKHLLHIEITESALLDDSDILQNATKRLKQLGYSLWLDDFGSGYSSFNVLKDFEFDVLKLDMKFLTGFDSNEKAKDIIKSVVSMADLIGMKTLSEGVETEEQSKFLKSINCGRLQGYHYSKPIPYEDLMKKIDDKVFTVSKNID